MKITFIIGLVTYMSMSLNSLCAQNDFAVLEKNVNVRASGLKHELNTTKDTLLLSSTSNINKVYAVNMDYEREVEARINAKSFKIPLASLTKGKHVFVVVQSPLRIVFVVKILKDNSVVLPTNTVKLTALKNEDD